MRYLVFHPHEGARGKGGTLLFRVGLTPLGHTVDIADISNLLQPHELRPAWRDGALNQPVNLRFKSAISMLHFRVNSHIQESWEPVVAWAGGWRSAERSTAKFAPTRLAAQRF